MMVMILVIIEVITSNSRKTGTTTAQSQWWEDLHNNKAIIPYNTPPTLPPTKQLQHNVHVHKLHDDKSYKLFRNTDIKMTYKTNKNNIPILNNS